MITYTITGYEQSGICQHCGRALKHCILLGDGVVVGATCFDKQMTKPRVAQGKKYRVGSDRIIELAKAAQFWNASRRAVAGIQPHMLNFEAA